MVPNVAKVTVLSSEDRKEFFRLTNRPFACNIRWDTVRLLASVRVSSGS